MATWTVRSGGLSSAGTSGLISWQRERVGREEERHADGHERDRAQRVAPAQVQVAEHDPERERDAELVQVAPRPATDEDGADDEPDCEQDERHPRERLRD